MNSTRGERKSALLLATLPSGDRKRLLAALPAASSARVRRLVAQLLAQPWPVAELAQQLLAEEGDSPAIDAALDVDRLLELSELLPPAWFARVLAACAGVDRSFCLSLLDPDHSASVARELTTAALPVKLATALKTEALGLASPRWAA